VSTVRWTGRISKRQEEKRIHFECARKERLIRGSND